MVEPFVGSIQYFAFDYAPQGYKVCDGSTLPVKQNQALYALIGIQFGGDSTNFKVPDMRGRTMIGAGGAVAPVTHSYVVGNSGGAENVLLPLIAHTHTAAISIQANSAGVTTSIPLGAFPGTPTSLSTYATAPLANSFLGAPKVTVGDTGSTSPIDVRNPFLALTCCIAIVGYFPPRD